MIIFLILKSNIIVAIIFFKIEHMYVNEVLYFKHVKAWS